MSLPSYVVNFDELQAELEELIGKSLIRKKAIESGRPFVFSCRSQVAPLRLPQIVFEKEFVEESFLTNLDFVATGWKPQDNWTLYLDDRIIVKEAPLTELYDRKSFINPLLIEEGATLKIIFDNKSGNSRDVIMNLETIVVEEKW